MSAEMTAPSSVPIEATRHEEEERKRHLLLDPKPQGEMNQMVMDSMKRTGLEFWIVMAVLAVLALVGFLGSWLYQIRFGMGVAGIRKPVFWGVYITCFVFWIGISHSGTFVSAILRVFKVEWRRPITRGAELMTSTSLLVAVSFLGIHVGRTWRGYWIVPYPNQRTLWPNFHSPFLWDEIAIVSYLVGSSLYLFLPLIPDLAMARDHSLGWRQKLYRILSLGWRGTESEWRNLTLSMTIFAFAIIPVMFSVHTIVSWDFAMTRVVGWHSSIFAPYFVVGAIYSGVSAVVNILFLVRWNMKLDYFVREEHFEALGKLMLILSFTWTYFFFADLITEWYGGDAIGHTVLDILFRGQMAPFFYIMLICNIVIPWLTLWNSRVRRTPIALFFVALAVNVGMFMERYSIVTGYLRRNRMPFDWGTYAPSWVEALIALGSVATFLLLYGLLSRVVPMIPVWEVREGQMAHLLRRFGRTKVTSVSELE
jgi:Ni/Fe-hydrogenase subunit HybB-like protein